VAHKFNRFERFTINPPALPEVTESLFNNHGIEWDFPYVSYNYGHCRRKNRSHCGGCPGRFYYLEEGLISSQWHRQSLCSEGPEGYPIFATQDWHPGDHISFYTNHPGGKAFEVIEIEGRTQVLWPPHCVQGTENAGILVDNNLFLAVVQKGRDTRYDSYSGFMDDGGQKTEMDEILKRKGIQKIVVYGIATDYCVKATALDAADAGYKVLVIEGLCKGVAPETSAKALTEMKEKGIMILKELDLQKIKTF